MNILILGGAGFVGSNLVRYCLQDKKNKITVIDSLEPRLSSSIDNVSDILHKINFIKGDIRDSKLMKKVVVGNDVIFNCAAQSSHPLSLKDPIFDIQTNCIGNITVLESVKNCNPSCKVVYISSSTVIGKAINDIVDESHGEKPLDIYSANKGVSEKYHYIYHKVYDLNTIVLRFANIYGPYGKGFSEYGFVNYFIWLAQHGKKIPIYGDGNQTRNVMYVEDAVDLIYKCANERKLIGQIFFAVHTEHYTVKQIAQEIIKIFSNGSIEMIPWPDIRRRIEIDKLQISGKKLYQLLHWKPRFNLQEGLEKTKSIIEKQSYS